MTSSDWKVFRNRASVGVMALFIISGIGGSLTWKYYHIHIDIRDFVISFLPWLASWPIAFLLARKNRLLALENTRPWTPSQGYLIRRIIGFLIVPFAILSLFLGYGTWVLWLLRPLDVPFYVVSSLLETGSIDISGSWMPIALWPIVAALPWLLAWRMPIHAAYAAIAAYINPTLRSAPVQDAIGPSAAVYSGGKEPAQPKVTPESAHSKAIRLAIIALFVCMAVTGIASLVYSDKHTRAEEQWGRQNNIYQQEADAYDRDHERQKQKYENDSRSSDEVTACVAIAGLSVMRDSRDRDVREKADARVSRELNGIVLYSEKHYRDTANIYMWSSAAFLALALILMFAPTKLFVRRRASTPIEDKLPIKNHDATSVSEKICPMCAETVKAAAKKCKHCGDLFD